MVEQSDLYMLAKTSMENSCSEPANTIPNYRKIADQVSVDPNRIQSLSQIAAKCLQTGEKDFAVWFIDFLDYLTATSEQVICPFVDNTEFLENILRLALQFHIIQALLVVVCWEPNITTNQNQNLVLKKKLELAMSSSEFTEALKGRPQLKHTVSKEQKIKDAINSARTVLRNSSHLDDLDFSVAASITQLEDARSKLMVEETKILALIKDEPPKSDNRKALEAVQDDLQERISELEGFIEENLSEQDKLSRDSSKGKTDEDESGPQRSNSKTDSGEHASSKSLIEEETKRSSIEDLGEEGKNKKINLSNIDPKIAASMLTIEELLKYKLSKCPNAECPYRPSKEKSEKFKNKDLICPFWHFDYDKRREVILQSSLTIPQPMILKTEYHAKMCEKKGCRFKEKCFFSHNFFESYYHPLYYKKFKCLENLGNECDRNKYCPYVHQKEEEDCWTEILKARAGIDRNKPHKPIEAENERPSNDLEAESEIAKADSAGINGANGKNKKKEMQGTNVTKKISSKIEPPPGKILEKPNQPIVSQKREIGQENLSSSPEPKLRGFKGKEKKEGLKLSSQPFIEPGKKEEIEKKDEKKSDMLFDVLQSRAISSTTPVPTVTVNTASSLQPLAVLEKKDRKSSDERERKGKGHKKDGQKAIEREQMDEGIANRAFFIENEEIPIANKQRFQFITKSKELKKPKAITKSICAMLNTEGGWIFLGVEESGRVTGIPMKFEERDQFKQTLINSLQRFSPKLGNNDYSISFVDIKNQSHEAVMDLYVIKIQIKKAEMKNFHCNEKEEYYHRSDVGKNEKYSPRQVQDEIIKRRAPSIILASTQGKEIGGGGSNQPLNQSTVSNSNLSTLASSLQGQMPNIQHSTQQINQQASLPQQQPQQQYSGNHPFSQNYPPPFFGPTMNFPPQNPFSMGFNPYSASPYQVPQGTFVLFVPYNPYQPNSISQVLNALFMAQGMPAPQTQNSSEAKPDENKIPEPNMQSGNPSFFNPFSGTMPNPPLQHPQYQNFNPNFNQAQGIKQTSGPSQTTQTSSQRETLTSNLQKPLQSNQIQQPTQQSLSVSGQKTQSLSQQHGYMPSYSSQHNLMNPSMMSTSQAFSSDPESSTQIPNNSQRQGIPGYPSYYTNYPGQTAGGPFSTQSQGQNVLNQVQNQLPNQSNQQVGLGSSWGGSGQFISSGNSNGSSYNGYPTYAGMNQNIGQTIKYSQDAETSKMNLKLNSSRKL